MNPSVRWAACALLAGTAFMARPSLAMQHCDIHFSNGVTLAAVPVAATLAQQVRGLSKTHDPHPAMLFLWPETASRTFWMRDTWIPLEVGFFDGHGDLFQVEPMAPNTDTRHTSKRPAQFALELGAHQYAALRLVPGVGLTLGQCTPIGTSK